ncbi:MAG: helix-turn-helix domain-containing protein [Candidatus Aenigmatarchaeota archaeon]
MTKDISRQLEKLLRNESKGLTIAEIADRLNVHRHTARKYVDCLAAEKRIIRRYVGKATVCYSKRVDGMKACLIALLFICTFSGVSEAVSDCTGTDIAPCQQCDTFAINISLYYPNGSLAAYTLNQTLQSEGSCSCSCYTEDCCATDTYKNYTATWDVDYTYCPVEGDYNATMDANSTQETTEWETSSDFTLYTVNWDTDQNWCQCKVGASKWNIGFGPGTSASCCEDDAGEYARTRVCSGGVCTTDPTDDACCNATDACVWESGCYLDGYDHPTLSGVVCQSGSWFGQTPQWRSQGTNDTDNIIPSGGTINLTAEGYSAAGLDFGWLETNESGGTWLNYSGSYSGSYNSPIDMEGAVAWEWSNFTWSNSSVTSGTAVGWRIWYNDTYSNENVTNTLTFLVDSTPEVYNRSISPASPDETNDLVLYVKCADKDSGASLTAYWNWWKDDTLQPLLGGSFAVSNGTNTLVNTLDNLNTTEGETWTAEVWCGDGFANSSTANESVVILAGPEHTMQIMLTINGTGNNVYVPGTGVLNAGSLGSLSVTPNDYYLVSYAGGAMRGLVFFYQTPTSLVASNTSTNHTLTMNSVMKNSNTFLVFSKGDWNNVNNLIGIIESGTFLLRHSPSFAYGLGTKSVVSIMLKYGNIDVLGETIFGRGDRTINLVNQNAGGKAVNITVS